ncbi:phage tail sheath subtilisin-like domain-containing protein [Pantoea agglomerans]|uniref:Phage tail sheath subtilisin-like domain-containing protein n=1 Tax=Enterobacter agglomerans TaxID=549 RepID=A0ACC5RR44_ENTAG|nr:phage tail sheath subtilisin-like domain-containing protein [Pantoea agglomerans]MBK4727174.1 phage tail sheath subtilisin-like domain-containing protein [Pantoea agglomerans]
MSENYHHGVQVKETTDLSTMIRDIDTAVIGVVCTADDADAVTFPLNTPVLLTRVRDYLGKAGKSGTLYTTLKAISDQASPKTVVIRVADASKVIPSEGETAPTQDQLVIGGVGADGRYTGMFALLTAEPRTGEHPRVLAVPGLDTKVVALQLAVIAEKLRAFAYVGANGCKTIAEAKTYREDFSEREIMVIYPDFIAYNSLTAANETIPATAYAIGLRAKIDAEQGWHKVLSNVPVSNVLGISADVYWTLQGDDTDADDLNSKGITTLIKRDGFRFWGSRTCDAETYFFESYTRTAQILADTIAEAHFPYVDKPLTPSLIKDIVDGINRKGAALVTANRLLGFQCWFDYAGDNTPEALRDGKATIRYKYTPVPPLEHLELIQEFTDEYIAAFAQA